MKTEEQELELPDFLQGKAIMTISAEMGDGKVYTEDLVLNILLQVNENDGREYINFMAPRLDENGELIPDPQVVDGKLQGESVLWSSFNTVKVDGISVLKEHIDKGLIDPNFVMQSLGQAYLTEKYGNIVKAGEVISVPVPQGE